MKKNVFFLILTSFAILSCGTTKKSTNNIQSSKTSLNSTPKATDDGLSFATAIVITETSETSGVNAEYKWIKDHYSDYRIKQQSLSMKDKKPYDIIIITLADKTEQSIYFDISNYFGKF